MVYSDSLGKVRESVHIGAAAAGPVAAIGSSSSSSSLILRDLQ